MAGGPPDRTKDVVAICGIAGWALSPDEKVNANHLAVTLLLGIKERGGHATGAAFFEDGQAYVQKGPIPAPRFVEELQMGPVVPTAVLHTRFGTKGSARENVNNHPIEIPGKILGVHNGCLWNDDDLFAQIGPDKRLGEVDSEAIFAALAYMGDKAPAVLSKIEGSASVAWIEPEGDPYLLHVARVSSSPLVYAFTEAGSFLFASTHRALATAAQETGLDLVGGPYDLREGVYLRVRAGQVIGKHQFEAMNRASVPLTALERRALNLA